MSLHVSNMACFYCSVVIPPHRFVNREKFDALCMWDAFLKVSHKYKVLHRQNDVIYCVEYCGKKRYYDHNGKVIK